MEENKIKEKDSLNCDHMHEERVEDPINHVETFKCKDCKRERDEYEDASG